MILKVSSSGSDSGSSTLCPQHFNFNVSLMPQTVFEAEMLRTTATTKNKTTRPTTVRHPQQAGFHGDLASRDRGMSGLVSEPAVLWDCVS